MGWDIGGANLKTVRVEDGVATLVLEQPFEVWRDPAGLATALTAMAREVAPARRHAVTMTAELADCFRTKREGVRAVLTAVRDALPGADIQVLASDGSFLDADAAALEPLRVAGANWRAAAEWVAGANWHAVAEGVAGESADGARAGILADVGSTTTDLVPFGSGRVLAEAVTDTERLVAGELVYTGVQRTPLSALLRTVPFRGGECRVAAECFAIAADAHLWLGDLEESAYTSPTPDGGPATREGSAARLARVVCADAEMLGPEDVTAIARAAREEQLATISSALGRVAERLAPAAVRVVAAGSGSWMARDAARRCGLDCDDLEAKIGRAARVLPAFATAALLLRRRSRGVPTSPLA